MSIISFEKEFKEYFKELDTPLKVFLNEKYRKSKYENYFVFFDDFLFSYGIVSFNAIPYEDNSKYMPYVNCQENNIFDLDRGITDLSKKAHALSQSNGIIAKFLINKLSITPLSKFENWSVDM